MTSNSGIYKITSPTGKVYIGEAINIKSRLNRYMSLRCKSQTKLYNSFIKYGIEEHIFEVVEECDVDKLMCRERYWQDFYDTCDSNKGLNLKLTSCGDKKQIFSEDSIKKMKQTFEERGTVKGENNPMFGKKHSIETKKKMSDIKKGQHSGTKNPQYGKFGKEHPAYGNKASKEQLEHAREINMFGKNPGSKIVIDAETGVFYESASELAHVWGINKYTLRSKLNGHLKNNTNFKYC